MEVEIAITVLLLVALTFLATVDMSFGQLSDVGLRRLISEHEDLPATSSITFLREILENRPRFSFTISAAVQIFLVAVSVLVTLIAMQWFTDTTLIAVALLGGLILAGIFRQFLPRLFSLRTPEATLLWLLPLVRPFYRLLAFAADPWHRSFDRLRRK